MVHTVLIGALAALTLPGPSGTLDPAAPAPGRAWVFFADKGIDGKAGFDAAVAKLEATYDRRAVARRRARRTDPGLFDERDFPLVPAYVEAVRATGAQVRVESTWVNAVSVEATPRQLRAIAGLPFVAGTRPVARGARREPAPRPAPGPGPAAGFYGMAEEHLAQINVIALHAQGFTGGGVVIGILDTGFLRTHEAFNEPGHELQVVAEHDFVKGDGNTAPEPGDDPEQHMHGTMILGTLGAYKPGTYVGTAYDASFILCKTEDVPTETEVEEDYYVAGLQFIEAHGGDVATSSLAYTFGYMQGVYDGDTAVCTKGVNIATANGVYCCTAEGNNGHDNDPNTSSAWAPADAFQVISCGAVSNEGSVAGFSSDGPTTDKRLKPEVLARGVDTPTVAPWDDGGYAWASGTSLSTPLVAGAVACLAGARPTWSVDQMRAMLCFTASDFVQNGEPDPLFVRGYGIIDAAAAYENDCNANGVPDGTDVEEGTSRDCDGDGAPDECRCAADFDRSGGLDVDDFIAFQTGFGLQQPCADFDASGEFDIDDFIAFQTAYGLGCP